MANCFLSWQFLGVREYHLLKAKDLDLIFDDGDKVYTHIINERNVPITADNGLLLVLELPNFQSSNLLFVQKTNRTLVACMNYGFKLDVGDCLESN